MVTFSIFISSGTYSVGNHWSKSQFEEIKTLIETEIWSLAPDFTVQIKVFFEKMLFLNVSILFFDVNTVIWYTDTALNLLQSIFWE